MIVRFRTTLKSAMLAPIKTFIDAGSGPGTITIYTGTIPATPETAITSQLVLGTVTFSDPCGTETGGVLTMASIAQDTAADRDGTAAWARIADSAGNAVMDVDVSNTSGSGAIKLNTTAIVAGGPIRIDSCVISFP